jgi:hypothetical protein
MDEVVPRRVDSLTIAGGGASYLRSEISQYLDWAKPDWNILSKDDPLLHDYPDSSLRYRIGDVHSAYVNCLAFDNVEVA